MDGHAFPQSGGSPGVPLYAVNPFLFSEKQASSGTKARYNVNRWRQPSLLAKHLQSHYKSRGKILPRPGTPGRGAGRGAFCTLRKPLTPKPLSPEYRGEGSLNSCRVATCAGHRGLTAPGRRAIGPSGLLRSEPRSPFIWALRGEWLRWSSGRAAPVAGAVPGFRSRPRCASAD